MVETKPAVNYVRKPYFYDNWMEEQGIPIYRDYYIADGRTLELGDWDARGHKAALLQLEGCEGVSEARISEIAPGGRIAPVKFALEEVVYVLQGRGVATVWADNATATRIPTATMPPAVRGRASG